jgi:hypothetical protein
MAGPTSATSSRAGPRQGRSPISAISRESTVVASKCAKVVAGAGSVRSSAGTYTACTEVIEPLRGRRDALLQRAHLRGQRGLITDGARDAAEERGHFGARLREAEDVVHEEEHVLAFDVAEVLGDGERREGDAGARAGRLVHLAVDQRGLREHGLAGVQLATRSSRGRGRCLHGCARRRQRSRTRRRGPSRRC